MKQLPDAEDVNYWQTGNSSPDTILNKTKALILEIGGSVTGEAYGSDGDGNAAYMLQFRIGLDTFKVIWPVLPSRGGKDLPARRQAVTMMYHDVKARCVSAKVLGVKSAFFNFLCLPDGRNMSEATMPEILTGVPNLLHTTVNNYPSLPDYIDGDLVE